MGAGVAYRAVVFQLAMGAGLAHRAVAFQLAVGTRVTLLALAFLPLVRASLTFPHHSPPRALTSGLRAPRRAKTGVVALRGRPREKL